MNIKNTVSVALAVSLFPAAFGVALAHARTDGDDYGCPAWASDAETKLECRTQYITLTPQSFTCGGDASGSANTWGERTYLTLPMRIEGSPLQFGTEVSCAETLSQLLKLQQATPRHRIKLAYTIMTSYITGTEFKDGTVASATCVTTAHREILGSFVNLDTSALFTSAHEHIVLNDADGGTLTRVREVAGRCRDR